MRRGTKTAAVLTVVTALAVLVGGCGSSTVGAADRTSGPAGGAGSGSARPGGGTASGIPLRKVVLGFSAKGSTVTLRPNEVLEVVLRSTYWQFRPVTGGVLSRGTFVTRPEHSHVMGSGAGTAAATFRALKPGTAHVVAARQSCGEAMRCLGGQGSFTLVVVVH